MLTFNNIFNMYINFLHTYSLKELCRGHGTSFWNTNKNHLHDKRPQKTRVHNEKRMKRCTRKSGHVKEEKDEKEWSNIPENQAMKRREKMKKNWSDCSLSLNPNQDLMMMMNNIRLEAPQPTSDLEHNKYHQNQVSYQFCRFINEWKNVFIVMFQRLNIAKMLKIFYRC